MGLRATFLGTGTSTGVPVIACSCDVCRSSDGRNRRLRSSLLVESPEVVLWIDTTPDFRQQALRQGVERIDAVLFTHAHADHIFGLDDLRVFNFRQRAAIPCHGSVATLEALRRTFAYIFEPGCEGGGKPQIELVPVTGGFRLGDLEVQPVPVFHGSLEVLGFRFTAGSASLAYVTDCSRIPVTSEDLLTGVDTLILGALRYRSHPTHFTVEEAIAAAQRLAARRTFLTHLSHEVDHAAPRIELPPEVAFAHDGLVLEVD
ncbi:MAG: MBL fold metallo-hydrolase [Acidobacteriota bacterium]